MSTALCMNNVKTAALYFDRVLPWALVGISGQGPGFGFAEPVPRNGLINLIFDKPPPNGDAPLAELRAIFDARDAFIDKIYHHYDLAEKASLETICEYWQAAYLRNLAVPGTAPIREHFASYAQELGFSAPAMLFSDGATDPATTAEDGIIQLTRVPLINAEKADWDQIIELRLDRASRIKLQRLRAFVRDRYDGKSRALIEDDLASRIDEYEQVSKKHGFQIVAGSIGALLDSANLQAAAATGLAATLLGGPWAGLSATAVVEFGKFGLEFARRRRDMIDWQTSHPLTYVVQTNRKLNEA